MEQLNNGSDFLQVHQLRLQAIETGIDELVSAQPDRVSISIDAPGEARFTSEPYAAADYLNAGWLPEDDELDMQAAAQEMADAANQAVLAEAKMTAITLDAMGKMYWLASQFDDGDEEAEVPMPEEAYAATWQIADFLDGERQVSLKTTTIADHPSYGTARAATLIIEDGTISEKLTVTSIDGKVVQVTKNITLATENPITEKVTTIFDGDEAVRFIGQISRIMVESVSVRGDAEALANEIWLDYLGSAREKEVGLLLEEAVDMARAYAESMELSHQHGIDTPSSEDIDRYLALLV